VADDAPETEPEAGAPAADAAPDPDAPAPPTAKTVASTRVDKLPVQMLNDRILVDLESDGERRSTGGILIPATAQIGKRLAWGEVIAVGPNVRSMEPGDQVLFNPEDRFEVEVRGTDYLILRERDIHAVAAKRLEEGSTGLYL
jgi:chaperonin GroES